MSHLIFTLESGGYIYESFVHAKFNSELSPVSSKYNFFCWRSVIVISCCESCFDKPLGMNKDIIIYIYYKS